MKSRIFVILSMVALILSLHGSVQAEFAVTRLTENSYEDGYPHIEDDYVVWQGYVEGDWEIFLYNIATGETNQLTDNGSDDISPQTDGSYVVWQGFETGDWDIYVWNGGEVQGIPRSNAQDYSPQIADGLIVWTSDAMGPGGSVGPGEVILYDVRTQASIVLSAGVDADNTLDDSTPKISDGLVMWVQTDNQGEATFYTYDVSHGTTTGSPGYVWTDSPQTDQNLRVVTRHDGHDTEVFLYNSDSRRYHQVTDNGVQERCPTISGTHMAWMAGGEIFIASCKYLGLIRPEDNAVLSRNPAPTFTWEGIGYDKFKFEFSKDPGFPIGKTFSLPLGREWLSETSFTPTKQQWRMITGILRSYGYWRVKGEDGDGSTGLSDTHGFTIEEVGHTRGHTTTGESGPGTTTDDGEGIVSGIDTGETGAGTVTDGVDGESNGGSGWCFIDTAANGLPW